MKEKFINWKLFILLGYYGIQSYFTYCAILNLFSEPAISLVYLLVMIILSIFHHVFSLHAKINELNSLQVTTIQILAMLGKGVDTTMMQSAEIHRFLMQKLFTEDERAKLIALTYELHGDSDPDYAARVNYWLTNGPLERVEEMISLKNFHEEIEKVSN